MIEGSGARGRQPIETELAVEAVLSLLLAKAALHVVPFRFLERLFDSPLGALELSDPERSETRAAVLRAVETAARRLTIPTACFPRAIALQTMLRRRGVAVFGGEEATGLAVLARYGPGGRMARPGRQGR